MHKICVFTATRAEYGLLRWLMQDIQDDPELELQLVVSGAHLSPRFGETWREIAADGFEIDLKLEMLPEHSTSAAALAGGMGKSMELLAEKLALLRPDLLVVLGDRYELLAAASVALLLDIPLVHISGGDVTEGAIDDAVRHALTKLSSLHLVSSEEARRRVLQLGEEPERVFLCGGPGLDNLYRLPRLSRQELAASLGLDPQKAWALLTWHPETRISLAENLETLSQILTVLADRANPTAKLQQTNRATLPERDMANGLAVVATYANADLGGKEINEQLEQAAQKYPWLTVRPSLGQLRYVNMLRQVKFMLGNSSSAIFETPALGLPAINIGERQKGRALTPNIIQCGRSAGEIDAALLRAESPAFLQGLQGLKSPYGDGRFAEKAMAAIKTGLAWGQKRLLTKRFIDLP